MMNNISIVGLGFVGNAIKESLSIKGFNIICYDKYKNIGDIKDCLKSDIIFLCLPTPFDDIKEEYDKSSIIEICSYLSKNEYKGSVLLKSTVEPQTTNKLSNEFNLNLIHNPEFLTQRTAFDDFHNQKHIVLGKSESCEETSLQRVVEFYKKSYLDSEISICSSDESESVKIFCNSFYAVKIQFFNELYFLCDKINCSYDNVKDIMLKNNWINPMHTTVPGTDGEFGYGGGCFPKDTKALLKFMKDMETPSDILESTIKERDRIRNKK